MGNEEDEPTQPVEYKYKRDGKEIGHKNADNANGVPSEIFNDDQQKFRQRRRRRLRKARAVGVAIDVDVDTDRRRGTCRRGRDDEEAKCNEKG